MYSTPVLLLSLSFYVFLRQRCSYVEETIVSSFLARMPLPNAPWLRFWGRAKREENEKRGKEGHMTEGMIARGWDGGKSE